MLQNGGFLLTHPAEVSKQFFYIMGIVFPLSLLNIQVQIKETQNSMDYLLSSVNYQEHKWLIWGDLKVVRLVRGLQDGYTNYPCFLYL